MSGQAHLNIAHSSLIADYKSLMSQLPKVQTNYCYREANQCAGRLTKYGAKLEQDFIIYDSLLLLLFYDFSGMYFERLMPYSGLPPPPSPLSNKILVYQKRKKKKIYPQFLQFNKGSFDTLNENYYNIGNFLTKNKMCCYKIIKHIHKLG